MNNRLVFVHGRSQQHKDAAALKSQWVDALRTGLTMAGTAEGLVDS